MLVDRMQVALTGPQLGSGVATHYATAGGDHQAAFKQWWTGVMGSFPALVSAYVPAEGDTIEVETGLLQNVWSGGSAGLLTGGQSGAYAAGAGVCITWLTAGIVNGHRVRGRTFLIPLGGSRFDTNGTILDATVSQLREYTGILLGQVGADFKILHRAKDGHGGSAHSVTGYRIADRVSSLSSRR